MSYKRKTAPTPAPEPEEIEFRGHFAGYWPGTEGADGMAVVYYSSSIVYPEKCIIFEPGHKKGSPGEYRTMIDPFRPSAFRYGKAEFKNWFLTARQHLGETSIHAAEALLGVRRWNEYHAMLAVDLVAEAYRPFYENDGPSSSENREVES